MKISLGAGLLIASIGFASGCGEPFGSFTTTSTTGTGGATTGTGGATTSSTGGMTTGTGGAGVEQNCVNGLDDDNDGLTDCEDPDCSGFSCVPAPPAGWVGVAWLEASSAPAACPPGLGDQLDLFDPADLVAPAASCSCACGVAAGVACGTHMRCDPSAAQCAATGNMNGQSTSCGSNIPNVTFPAYCRADPPGAFGGACAPTAAGAAPQWSWAMAARACGTQLGGTCSDSASVCVPELAGAIGPCIRRAGDLACPAPYGKKTLYYDGQTVTDDRACNGSGCACGAPIGSTCDCGPQGCAVDLYGDAACGATQASVPTTAACGLVQSKPTAAKLVGVSTVPGACPPSGAAQPTGTVTPTAPVTVCCVP